MQDSAGGRKRRKRTTTVTTDELSRSPRTRSSSRISVGTKVASSSYFPIASPLSSSRSHRSDSTLFPRTTTSSTTIISPIPITEAPPHTVKNPYIHSGYVIHSSSKEAWLSAFLFSHGFHNEHINIFTGFLMFFVALWTYLQTLPEYSSYPVPFIKEDNEALRILAYAELWNTLTVVAYHSLLSVPSLYHYVSALDLAGISLLQIGVIYGHTIHGVSSFGNRYLQHRNETSSVPIISPSSLPFSPTDQQGRPSWISSSVGLLFGLFSLRNAIYYHIGIITLLTILVVSIRLYIQRESPPVLIFFNIVWYFILFIDYVLIRSSASSSTTSSTLPIFLFIILVGGATLYGIKFPEKYYPGKFDYIGHSHSIWHCCYVTAFALYSWDVVELAYKHSLDLSTAQ